MAGRIAADAPLVAKRLSKRLAKRDAHILDRVMVVDMRVAGAADRHVDQRMACQLIQHVIEKADPGRVGIGAGAIEVDLDGDIGLGGFAGYRGAAHRASGKWLTGA